MENWRNELREVVKSQAEREAEEQERRRKRIAEALQVADQAMAQSLDGLRFATEQLRDKQQEPTLGEEADTYSFRIRDRTVTVELDRETAVLKVSTNDGRPREFDFATDRHLAPKDVEEYVGRRLVETARAVQKEHPW